MQTNEKIRVLGLMSGTSLDGLDLAFCEFGKESGKWNYNIVEAKTIEYPSFWMQKLKELPYSSAIEWVRTDQDFGKYLGEAVNLFCNDYKIKPDLISSHGHTIFHQPALGFTGQIGNGAGISAVTGLPVVSDFRTLDVALNGQGAPLVPIGDELLFDKFTFCLNLGGISNISFQSLDRRIAFDICPVNQVLNYLSNKLGKNYDNEGLIAKQGTLNIPLFDKLNQLDYYDQDFPKSLGREWVENEIISILSDISNIPLEDQLHTFSEHAAYQMAKSINNSLVESPLNKSLFITGGGAHNTYLISRLNYYLDKNIEITIPDTLTINFKEALVFAFLGLLRLENKINGLQSVTGATHDSIGGALYGDFQEAIQKTVSKYSKT